MSATKARRLVPFKDFTHYLSIPLATCSSRPQLRASFALFERETAAIFPKGSVLNPDITRLNMGRLRLESEGRIDACSKYLHGLDMHEILRVAAVKATGGPPKLSGLPYQGEPPNDHEVATAVDLSPLKVDVSGLFSPWDDPSQTRVLKAWVIDRTHRLQHFQHMLVGSLFKAGFLANAFYSSILVANTALPINWGYKRIYDRSTGRWSSSPERPKTPMVDARDLIHGMKDFDWATNIQLEKLGVYALGSKIKFRDGGARMKQSKEVCSITLP